MKQAYDLSLIEYHRKCIQKDPSYWDEKDSLEFCIAKKMFNIGSLDNIAINLSAMYEDAKKKRAGWFE